MHFFCECFCYCFGFASIECWLTTSPDISRPNREKSVHFHLMCTCTVYRLNQFFNFPYVIREEELKIFHHCVCILHGGGPVSVSSYACISGKFILSPFLRFYLHLGCNFLLACSCIHFPDSLTTWYGWISVLNYICATIISCLYICSGKSDFSMHCAT